MIRRYNAPMVYRLLLLIPLVMAGCGTQRTITITSEPAGALVYLNDEEVGRTPVTVPFTFYGMYDVRLDAPGHEPLWTMQKADAPFWEYPIVDLVGETIGAENQLNWHFEMEPAVAAAEYDEQKLLDHARQMRATVREQN